MDEPNPSQDFARVKLDGERFAGARLPVSALSELENYTNLIREAAKLAWRADHPNEDLPEDFGADFDLVLTSVHNGSADCHLERLRPHLGDEDDYFDQSRERVGRELRQVLQGRVKETDDLLARIDAFGDLGSSLDEGDSLEVPSSEVDGEPVRITRSSYIEYIRPAHERSIETEPSPTAVRSSLYSQDGWIVGRLRALDVDASKFNMTTQKYGAIHGLWSNPQIFQDLKAVMEASEQAAIVRIYGSLRLRSETDLFRLNDASDVEFLATEGEPWSRRFIELASLESGWDDDDPDSEPVSFAALDGARKLLSHARLHEKTQPGIFPQGDGGVSLEWASPEKVYSVEVTPDDEFHLFHLDAENIPYNTETFDITAAMAFIEGVEFP
ncbi:hypothetical protein RQCS_11770 [Rhodococcus qingshengii]|uniref:hypothetical protein n=1 Tax=Rhodococcus qingshengii TaxID=334542 RepID=UPI0007E534E1|nr:hypothetical protein [Rhodococcus qingshengii]BCF81632.1 hypothetical protein RQCS_11770 [Rhodococcus qingshengii]